MRCHLNTRARRDTGFGGLFDDAEYREVHAYYADHPELATTPLHDLNVLAREVGAARVLVKDETARFGLSAFKILGVRYAIHRLGDQAAARGLVCATAGNHGRAVARAARDKHVPCTVFVPALPPGATDGEQRWRTARVNGMRADGAVVIDVDGSYEDAVRLAAEHAHACDATVISDTAWPGYEQIPLWIMAGYTQLFEEASGQWDRPPHAIFVQGGVGGLVCAAASWSAWRLGAHRPTIVACEPDGAACLLASAAGGERRVLPGRLETVMTGLRCAEPSPVAWPAVRDGVDAFVSVPDGAALSIVDRLRAPASGDPIIEAGPSGACSLAALTAVMVEPGLSACREGLGLDSSSVLMAVITEAG